MGHGSPLSSGVPAATDPRSSGLVLSLWEQRRQPRQVKGTALRKVGGAAQPPLTGGGGASGRWVWRGHNVGKDDGPELGGDGTRGEACGRRGERDSAKERGGDGGRGDAAKSGEILGGLKGGAKGGRPLQNRGQRTGGAVPSTPCRQRQFSAPSNAVFSGLGRNKSLFSQYKCPVRAGTLGYLTMGSSCSHCPDRGRRRHEMVRRLHESPLRSRETGSGKPNSVVGEVHPRSGHCALEAKDVRCRRSSSWLLERIHHWFLPTGNKDPSIHTFPAWALPPSVA